eukprot:CAMPEP_0171321966 /NCGR_PEP_ID=MMETSP0816-20121228/114674_1 /TAXON_ID=420281 /ORGANISM="Proboscia inermis, Strain CCAP1064/1" /LENGTH=570 /DNA_ID=CAMNT_0011820341 /DNA_START=251 /DNA_END=1960 /DNA_ORIENTATION=-
MVLEELVEAAPPVPPHGSSASHRTTFASRHVASFHNVTCGASADHSAKFSDGGLRRLESRRVGLVQAARESYMAMGLSAKKLLDSRGCKYIYASPSVAGGSTSGNTGGTAAAIERNVHRYRTQCLEIHRECASLSWVIAVRRSNCFSQALCIALTSYLSHVSDATRAVRNAAVWATHGYLLTYEGMLSSAGKEMGMIEDASDSIGMLHGVKIRLVVDDSHTHNNNTNTAPRACTERVAVDSTVVKWLEITWLPPNGNRRNPPAVAEQHSWPNVLITVGLDATYYGSRIPPPLQSTYISLVPVLFQMGVDIRQWSANKSANTKATIKEKKQKHFEEINYNTYAGNTNTATSNYDEEDEEEESGLPDNDRLIGLNTEAFRKLNAYAHAVRPQHTTPNPQTQTHTNALFGDLPNGVHPLLQPLHQSVLRSAGNTMEHGVLDHAAKTCATLGGGSMIFCKSGKDRTAMQVTLKQTQFILKERFRLSSAGQTQTHPNTNAPPKTNTYTEDASEIYRQATVMRTYGTRLALCEKNVGQPKYAFNSLQAKFMPKMLKPPVGVIAGFLKGGKIFTEGA